MKQTKRLFLIFFISTLSLIFMAAFLSCSQPEIEQGEEVSLEEEIEEAAGEAEEKSIEEEIIDVIEEKVDYDTAEVGAEINGFIPGYLCTNKDNYIEIEITNTSDFKWKKDGQNMVRIGYHYYYKEGATESYDNPTRTRLPNDVKPGDTVTVEVLVNDIKEEGNYILRIDPVLEGKFWFSSKGVEMLEGETYFGPCSNNG